MIIANQKVSAHLLYREVRCKGHECCDGGHIRWEVLELFERIRARCSYVMGRDVPIHINSGVRCQVHNIMVGGAKGSQHLKGLALDLAAPSIIGREEFDKICESVVGDRGGVGFYDWGNHIDARGELARWEGK